MTELSSHNNCIAPPEVFNILVCGLAGTGKSTLINTLCDGGVCLTQNHKLSQILADFVQYQQDQREQLSHQRQQPAQSKFVCFPPEKVRADTSSANGMRLELCELDMGDNKRSGRRMHVTFVEASNIGLAENNETVANDLLYFVERNLANAYNEENKLSRDPSLPDSQIHLCLYLISPTGAGVSTLDALIMKTIAPRVLIIPVLSKADCLTVKEIVSNKRSILAGLSEMNIAVCDFVYGPLANFDLSKKHEIVPTVPGEPIPLFSVMASDNIYEKGGRTVRMRRYAWGDREVEDPDISDLARLRTVLFETHGFAIRAFAERNIYEKYRLEQMSKVLPKMSAADNRENAGFASSPGLSLRHSLC